MCENIIWCEIIKLAKYIDYIVELDVGDITCHNKHFYDCLTRTKKIYNDIRIHILNGDSESVLIFSKRYPGCVVDLVSGDVFSEEIDAYFPSVNPCKKSLAIAVQSGVRVFQNDIAEYTEVFWDDYFNGYLGNDTSEFYSKLFPDPVHVADNERLELSLGSTINPRAIILNSGLDGRGVWVSLGRGSHIGADVLLNLGPTDFKVGNFTMISANFSAHTMRHTITHISNYSITKGPFKFFGDICDNAEPILIGNDVWIGEGVKCLSGVNIPNGCVVGAGSIVTSSLKPYGIYAGNPARLIRFRFEPEKIEILNSSEWWNYKYNYLLEIQDFFKKDVTNLCVDELKQII